MALNRENILHKTHYGLKIFAYVFRCYNQDSLLSLKGRECTPIANPLQDYSIIKIKIENGISIYQDINNPAIAGDVFDFAEQHFQLDGQELLEKIDQELYLSLKEAEEKEETDWLSIKVKTVFIPQISFYKAPVKNVIPNATINLKEVTQLVKSEEYKQKTFTLRNLNDKATARTYKSQSFDYVTFSGIFSKRADKNLLKHSGLITLDFDDLKEIEETKSKLLNDEYFETELLFISPSGNGIKWIIPIDVKTDTHLNYFLAISNYIKQTYQLTVDPSGKDVSRPCFLGHDSQAYINPKYL
jgi:hypothetical protein